MVTVTMLWLAACVIAGAPAVAAEESVDNTLPSAAFHHLLLRARGNEQPCFKDDPSEQSGAIGVTTAVTARSSCSCDVITGPGGATDCHCSGLCSDDEQINVCSQLLGPCECARDEVAALCDCMGYCHTREHRQYACEDADGCSWAGLWCEPEANLLGDDELAPGREETGDQL
eukprot:TRINITY_DN62762_c0_g1_i1.p1 TRINITY_DN62762_c0_g1~~TRINITY_DN62762_c0_g1_i1.p1  ORF type:complete len:173 (-),score=31.88 TRINITY_DN62762_c0_g1_i1:64-582(-)